MAMFVYTRSPYSLPCIIAFYNTPRLFAALWLVNTVSRGTIHFNAVARYIIHGIAGHHFSNCCLAGNSSATDALWRQWRGIVTPQWVSECKQRCIAYDVLSAVPRRLCFEWNGYALCLIMVCYKTHVDWPYSGNSIRLFPPLGTLSTQNLVIYGFRVRNSIWKKKNFKSIV